MSNLPSVLTRTAWIKRDMTTIWPGTNVRKSLWVRDTNLASILYSYLYHNGHNFARTVYKIIGMFHFTCTPPPPPPHTHTHTHNSNTRREIHKHIFNFPKTQLRWSSSEEKHLPVLGKITFYVMTDDVLPSSVSRPLSNAFDTVRMNLYCAWNECDYLQCAIPMCNCTFCFMYDII